MKVNGQTIELVSATYNLPTTVAGVQIDCSITRGYNSNGRAESWGLEKDARLRLWPAGSPLVASGTFGYPVRQKWFATDTQMANVPVFVDGGDRPGERSIYYHSGLDIGGSEGMVDVIAATDGLVVSVGEVVLDAHKRDTPVSPPLRRSLPARRPRLVLPLQPPPVDRRSPWFPAGSSRSAIRSASWVRREAAAAGRICTFEIKMPPAFRAVGHTGGLCLPVGSVPARIRTGSDCRRPSASFDLELATTVTLDGSQVMDTREGDIARYEWQFEDGSTADGADSSADVCTQHPAVTARSSR